jgi:DnaJ-class molecular chaperone
MVANAKKTDYECPICSGRGRVPGRLPGRTRLCPECHGTGRTTPIRREALLKRMKTQARA